MGVELDIHTSSLQEMGSTRHRCFCHMGNLRVPTLLLWGRLLVKGGWSPPPWEYRFIFLFLTFLSSKGHPQTDEELSKQDPGYSLVSSKPSDISEAHAPLSTSQKSSLTRGKDVLPCCFTSETIRVEVGLRSFSEQISSRKPQMRNSSASKWHRLLLFAKKAKSPPDQVGLPMIFDFLISLMDREMNHSSLWIYRHHLDISLPSGWLFNFHPFRFQTFFRHKFLSKIFWGYRNSKHFLKV